MKLVYITGTHSSGKSGLLKSVKDLHNVRVFPRQNRKELFNEQEFKLLYKNNTIEVAVFKNLSERLKSSISETKKQFEFSQNNPNFIILADHFILDCMAYIMTCYKLGWLNNKEFDILKRRFEKEFIQKTDFNYYLFFIKPSIEEVRKNFTKNNDKNSRIWERKTKFLETSHEMFSKTYTHYCSDNKNNWKIIDNDSFKNQKDFIIKNI